MAGKNSPFSCVKHREKEIETPPGLMARARMVSLTGAKSAIILFPEGLLLQQLQTSLITVTLL